MGFLKTLTCKDQSIEAANLNNGKQEAQERNAETQPEVESSDGKQVLL